MIEIGKSGKFLSSFHVEQSVNEN